jgi:hypothetical protein
MGIAYPTQEELNRIQTWPQEDYHGLMEFVRSLWWPDGKYGFERTGETYRLSTGGWSGNEDIVGALEQNGAFWSLFWLQSQRGGHYVFSLPTAYK